MQQCEVQPGETLVSISIREKVSVVVLRRLNKLYGNEIYAGQILSLRPIHSGHVAHKSCDEDSNTDVAERVPYHNLDGTKESVDSGTSDSKDGKAPVVESSGQVKSATLVENILDVRSSIASSASDKLSAIRSLMSSKKIPIDNSETPGRERTLSVASVASLSLSYPEKRALNNHDELESILPTLLGNRSILTVEQAKKLRQFLPSMQQIETWRLLYSVLNDGADLDSFFRKTKSHKYTLTIVKTMKGEMFGGFNSMEWVTSPNFYGSGESFLFKFDAENNCSHYPWTEQNDFFAWSSPDQIAMGGGGDGFGFVLDSDFATGESYKCATYGNPILVEKENGSFLIANAECWGFEGLFGKFNKSAQTTSRR